MLRRLDDRRHGVQDALHVLRRLDAVEQECCAARQGGGPQAATRRAAPSCGQRLAWLALDGDGQQHAQRAEAADSAPEHVRLDRLRRADDLARRGHDLQSHDVRAHGPVGRARAVRRRRQRAADRLVADAAQVAQRQAHCVQRGVHVVERRAGLHGDLHRRRVDAHDPVHAPQAEHVLDEGEPPGQHSEQVGKHARAACPCLRRAGNVRGRVPRANDCDMAPVLARLAQHRGDLDARAGLKVALRGASVRPRPVREAHALHAIRVDSAASTASSSSGSPSHDAPPGCARPAAHVHRRALDRQRRECSRRGPNGHLPPFHGEGGSRQAGE